ncbi:unnamed protein product [Prorocentrum cordatum]|uniref:HTTM domain-containing protein n=1 Tax=Prorocentrum cordatum TaxID=2364126 RepID=A0ABN9RML6_9DINO|nr:unnamed protein product [Polarella glacialis]
MRRRATSGPAVPSGSPNEPAPAPAAGVDSAAEDSSPNSPSERRWCIRECLRRVAAPPDPRSLLAARCALAAVVAWDAASRACLAPAFYENARSSYPRFALEEDIGSLAVRANPFALLDGVAWPRALFALTGVLALGVPWYPGCSAACWLLTTFATLRNVEVTFIFDRYLHVMLLFSSLLPYGDSSGPGLECLLFRLQIVWIYLDAGLGKVAAPEGDWSLRAKVPALAVYTMGAPLLGQAVALDRWCCGGVAVRLLTPCVAWAELLVGPWTLLATASAGLGRLWPRLLPALVAASLHLGIALGMENGPAIGAVAGAGWLALLPAELWPAGPMALGRGRRAGPEGCRGTGTAGGQKALDDVLGPGRAGLRGLLPALRALWRSARARAAADGDAAQPLERLYGRRGSDSVAWEVGPARLANGSVVDIWSWREKPASERAVSARFEYLCREWNAAHEVPVEKYQLFELIAMLGAEQETAAPTKRLLRVQSCAGRGVGPFPAPNPAVGHAPRAVQVHRQRRRTEAEARRRARRRRERLRRPPSSGFTPACPVRCDEDVLNFEDAQASSSAGCTERPVGGVEPRAASATLVSQRLARALWSLAASVPTRARLERAAAVALPRSRGAPSMPPLSEPSSTRAHGERAATVPPEPSSFSSPRIAFARASADPLSARESAKHPVEMPLPARRPGRAAPGMALAPAGGRSGTRGEAHFWSWSARFTLDLRAHAPPPHTHIGTGQAAFRAEGGEWRGWDGVQREGCAAPLVSPPPLSTRASSTGSATATGPTRAERTRHFGSTRVSTDGRMDSTASACCASLPQKVTQLATGSCPQYAEVALVINIHVEPFVVRRTSLFVRVRVGTRHGRTEGSQVRAASRSLGPDLCRSGSRASHLSMRDRLPWDIEKKMHLHVAPMAPERLKDSSAARAHVMEGCMETSVLELTRLPLGLPDCCDAFRGASFTGDSHALAVVGHINKQQVVRAPRAMDEAALRLAALGALEAFAARLGPHGVRLERRLAVVRLAWETARLGGAPEDGEADVPLTAEEAALGEVGAVAVSAAMEAAALRAAREPSSPAASAAQAASGSGAGEDAWPWIPSGASKRGAQIPDLRRSAARERGCLRGRRPSQKAAGLLRSPRAF